MAAAASPSAAGRSSPAPPEIEAFHTRAAFRTAWIALNLDFNGFSMVFHGFSLVLILNLPRFSLPRSVTRLCLLTAHRWGASTSSRGLSLWPSRRPLSAQQGVANGSGISFGPQKCERSQFYGPTLRTAAWARPVALGLRTFGTPPESSSKTWN